MTSTAKSALDWNIARHGLETQSVVAQVLAEGKTFEESAQKLLGTLCVALDQDLGVFWRTGWADNPDSICCSAYWLQTQLSCDLFQSLTRALRLALGEELPGLVWKQGEPIAWEIVTSTCFEFERGKLASRATLTHVLAFPAMNGKEIVGVIELWGRRPTPLDGDLHPTLRAIGNQVGQFLERQRIERELRDSQALYQSLVQNLPQYIFRKDRSGRLTFANQRYCDALRIPLHELLGKSDFDLFPYDLASKYVNDDCQIMATGTTIDTVEKHHRPDGSELHVHVVKTPVYDAHQNVIGVQGIFWDETAQVHAREDLARSERRYRQLTEATLDGIIVIDERGLIALFNPAAERLFDYSAQEILGQPAARLLPEPFDQIATTELSVQVSEYLGRSHELKGRRKDGSDFPIEVAFSILHGADDGRASERVLAAVRDLTERNKMRTILVQNEKLASIGLLSAGVAHEINNPLAFVANNLVVLERDYHGILALIRLYQTGDACLGQHEPDLRHRIDKLIEELDLNYTFDNLERLLQRTRDGVERVTRIVHSLRGMARTDIPQRQDTRLPDLITSSLEILHGRYKPLGVIVEQEHDPEPIVSCVPTQMSQVILNLLVNAYQAIESAPREQGRIRVRTHRHNDDLLLEVNDNGCGILEENFSRLFDPFFTTKEVGVGTGLGLAITHNIVTAHGGRIEVDSEPTRGTTFRIYLPLKSRKDRA